MSSFDFAREKTVLENINEYRRSQNLKPYLWHDFAANLARQHSQNMAEKRIPFSHEGINDRLKQIKDTSKFYSGGSENVAYSKPDMNPVGAWQKSVGHNKNLLNNYSHCGIGLVKNNGEFYYTGIFVKIQ